MKLTHVTLAFLWVFVTTVEAQNYPQPAGPGRPWMSLEEHPYTAPEVPVTPRSVYRQETVNIYTHPDDGPPSEAPYITVPVGPGTGDGYWVDPFDHQW